MNSKKFMIWENKKEKEKRKEKPEQKHRKNKLVGRETAMERPMDRTVACGGTWKFTSQRFTRQIEELGETFESSYSLRSAPVCALPLAHSLLMGRPNKLDWPGLRLFVRSINRIDMVNRWPIHLVDHWPVYFFLKIHTIGLFKKKIAFVLPKFKNILELKKFYKRKKFAKSK